MRRVSPFSAIVASLLLASSVTRADPSLEKGLSGKAAALDTNGATSDDPNERWARMQAQIQAQNEQIRSLYRMLSALRAPPREDPDRLALRLSGFVQADWVVYRQSSLDEISGAQGDPLNDERFLIRRAHLRADLESRFLLGGLEINANTMRGPEVQIFAAEASARFPGRDSGAPPYLMATIGLFRIPFGIEIPERDNERIFIERSTMARALFPGLTDLGVRLSGGYRFLRYSAALMNGNPIGERAYPGRDPNGAKDLMARVGIDTEIGRSIRVQAGFSGLSGKGFHRGTPSTKDVLVWRDENENGLVESTEVQVIPGASATPSANFPRFALGGDLRVSVRLPIVGTLRLEGSIVRAINLDRSLEPADPVSAGRDLRELGFYAGFTQEITRYGIIGFRYDRYDPDADAEDQRGPKRVPKDSTYSTFAFAAALRYASARLIAEFDHHRNALGRTRGGLPTTLGDDTFTIRGQVVF